MSSKYVSATGGQKNTVIYKNADGVEFIHSGGTRAWRNYNPGNIRSGEKSGLSIGAAGGFAVFPDYESGRKALKMLLKRVYASMQLDQVFKKYAPSSDNNDPAHYTELVKKYSGLDASKKVGDLSDDELDKFMDAIKRVEGWKEGKIEEVPHAQQFVVKSVDGKPLSGVAYLMSFFTSKGEEKKVSGTTDHAGKTEVVKTDTKSPVTLKLPRPNPGQSIKGGGDTPTGKHVVAAEVKAKPWYEKIFSSAEDSSYPKDKENKAAAPAPAAAKQPPKPPTTGVKMAGAIQTSATKKKAAQHVEQVIKEPGLYVTWQFDTSVGSKDKLRGLPYFVADYTDGTAKPIVEGQEVKLMDDLKIRMKVPFDRHIVLFLGSDAKAKYRSKPMYGVKTKSEFTDIVVKVQEKKVLLDAPADEVPHDPVVEGSKQTFQAKLYGSTWMRFTHKFTPQEAAEMSADGGAWVQDVVTRIYKGEMQGNASGLSMTIRKPNGNNMTISWPADAFSNCRQTIPTAQDAAGWKAEIIPRVNPNTYQAFLQAALEMDAESIRINSGWRPMLGSVLHRIGVGLDVGTIKINGHSSDLRRNTTQAERDYNHAQGEMVSLQKLKHRTAEQEQRLNQLKATEAERTKRASDAIKQTDNDDVRHYLAKLRANGEVRQTFDPWEMDKNVHDNQAATQNRSSDGLEKLHLTHLHITVYDKELGHG